VSKLGELVIELAANTARLQSDLGKAVGIAERAAGKIKTAFKFAGGGLIGAMLVSSAKQAIEFGDNINKAAIKAGLGGRAMSELAYAAKLADVDIAALSTGIKKMQVALSQAASGAKLPVEALGALGLKIEDIKNLSPDRQFELIGDQLSKLEQPADRARVATELFGKAGADLLPLFEQGAEGIRKAREEAEKLGLAFDDKQLQKLSQADDAIKRLSASWEGFAAILVSKVAPNLAYTMDRLAGVPLDTNEQIANLEDQLKSPRSTRGMGAETERKRLQQEIARLRQVSVDQSKREMGLAGGAPGPKARGFDTSSRFDSTADKFWSSFFSEVKENEDRSDKYRDMVLDLNRDINDVADDTLHKDIEREAKRLDIADEWYEKWIDSEKKLAAFREEQAAKLSDTAQIWKDATLQAIDDIINTGKVRWDEFAKYLATRLIQTGVSKAFDNLFSGSGGGKKSGGSGLWSGLSSLVGSLFSSSGGNSAASWVDDFRANGGAVQAGKSYLVGERGAEILTMGTNGNVTPNSAIGGRSVALTQNNHITYNGSDQQLQRILREQARQIVEGLSREHQLVGT
jgi:hypothetical protein